MTPDYTSLIHGLRASDGSKEAMTKVFDEWAAREKAKKDRHIPWLTLRRMCRERDGVNCFYCGIETGNDWHCDHVIPRSKGGENTLDNVVVSCPACNHSKRDRPAPKRRGKQ